MLARAPPRARPRARPRSTRDARPRRRPRAATAHARPAMRRRDAPRNRATPRGTCDSARTRNNRRRAETFDPLGLLDVERGDDGVFAPAFGCDQAERDARDVERTKRWTERRREDGRFLWWKITGEDCDDFRAVGAVASGGRTFRSAAVDRAAFAESLAGGGGDDGVRRYAHGRKHL